MNERHIAIFWSRVTKSDGCWEHSGSLGSHGYPQATWGTDGASKLAHRVSYEIHFGPVPDGLFVCHRCNNRKCVRPDHLYSGTHKENMADMARAGHPRRKLTPNQALAVRASKRTQRELADEYGVSPRTIYNVIVGRNYRFVA